MTQYENLEIELDVGEDFAVQFHWTDEDGESVPIETPCRMDVRDSNGDLVLQFTDTSDFDTEPHISITGYAGVLQVTCPRALTAAVPPGRYECDLWAVSSAGTAPFEGGQLQKIIFGSLIAARRITIMEDMPS